MEQFLRHDQIYDEKLPHMKIRQTSQNRNSLISTSNYQRYTTFTSRYMLLWKTNTIKYVQIFLRITKGVKLQDGRQLCSKIVLVIRWAATKTQILKFNSHLYTLNLQFPSYSKFSQISYETDCSHELRCRKYATWLWNKYVLIFF